MGAGLSDAQVLLASDTIVFPQLFSHGRGMIKRNMIWYGTFLPSNHPLIYEHQAFLNNWLLNEAEYEILTPQDSAMAHFVPTMFCRWFQLRLSNYINRQWGSATTIDVPDFCELFRRIDVGDPWEVRLPARYDRMLRSAAGGSSRGNNEGDVNRGGGGGINNGGDVGDGGDGAGTVGGGGGGGGAGSGGGGGGAHANAIVRNAEWKPNVFQRFARLAVRVRDVLRLSNAPPPSSPHDSTGNTTMCVAYHVKGVCNERCGRAVDHAAHTAAQNANLVTWCVAHYVCP